MSGRLQNWGPVLLVGGLLAVAALFVVGPASLMMPSRDHTLVALQRAYGFTRAAPAMTALLAVIAVLIAARSWQRGGTVAQRAAAAVLTLALIAVAFFVRVSLAERVFAPLSEVRTVPVTTAEHVAGADMVLGVALAGQARAYPVRMVAYHHLVNDHLADEPFVVTY